ncbi:hypothetical protein [Nocardia sp. NPDC048505]|uniref:hypothetical protein n=1 Tax=unclassified Nocardia TaxID=2637762 RepID=UPI00340AFD49
MSMILSIGLGFGSVVADAAGAPVVVAAMAVVFVVQVVGLALTWRAAPTGAARTVLGCVFAGAWLLAAAILIAGFTGAVSLLSTPLHAGLLVFVFMQGCYGVWRQPLLRS